MGESFTGYYLSEELATAFFREYSKASNMILERSSEITVDMHRK